MLIARKERSTHWYDPAGTPCHEVPKADGQGMRPTTIRDAAKLGLFPSVTNILSVLGKPGLVNWQIEQGILAAITLPRKIGETDHDFAHRALADSQEQVVDAAKDGSRLHDLASEFLTRGAIPTDGQEASILAPFMAWAASNVAKCIYSEMVMVNPVAGYAGRIDAFVELKAGGYAVVDLKTQDAKKDAKGNSKLEVYDEWPLQLAAYAACEALQFWQPSNHKLISVVLDRNQPAILIKEWQPDARHLDTFLHACQVWAYIRKWNPVKKAA